MFWVASRDDLRLEMRMAANKINSSDVDEIPDPLVRALVRSGGDGGKLGALGLTR